MKSKANKLGFNGYPLTSRLSSWAESKETLLSRRRISSLTFYQELRARFFACGSEWQ